MARYMIKETAKGTKRLYKQSWFPLFWPFVGEYKFTSYARKYVEQQGGEIVKNRQHPMMRAKRMSKKVDKS